MPPPACAPSVPAFPFHPLHDSLFFSICCLSPRLDKHEFNEDENTRYFNYQATATRAHPHVKFTLSADHTILRDHPFAWPCFVLQVKRAKEMPPPAGECRVALECFGLTMARGGGWMSYCVQHDDPKPAVVELLPNMTGFHALELKVVAGVKF